MNQPTPYRPLPPRENQNCFGCSLTNPSGLQMTFYTDDSSVLTWVTVPDHLCGWGNLVHGGVTSTILDEVMGWTALHLLKRFTLTKSIQIEFLRPLYIGKPLKAEGKVFKITNKREAIMEGCIYDQTGKACAKATGIFGLFTADHIKKLRIMDEEMIDQLEQIFVQ